MAKVYFNNVSFKRGNRTFNFYNTSIEVPDDAIPGADCPEISRTLSWQGYYEAISLDTNMDLEYHEGEEEKMVVFGPENWINNLDFFVEYGCLKIQPREANKSGCFASRPKLIIHHQGLKELRGTCSGDMTLYGKTALESLVLTSSDTVRFVDGIESANLCIQIKGSTEVTIQQGRIRHLHIDILGSGKVTATNLLCLGAEINLVGSGQVSLAGETDRLTAVLTGSGKILCGDFKASTGSVTTTGGLVECKVDHLGRVSNINGTIINH